VRRPLALLGASVLVFAGAAAARPAERSLAVTFDDLPGSEASLVSNEPAALAATTRRLLAVFATHRIPVTAFVNEGKLFREGETRQQAEARIAVLKLWVDAGIELGNHSYSHFDLNKTPLDAFEADVTRGEPVTRQLLLASGRTLRYFRHPFLHVGLELEKRRAFEAFLAQAGYRVAPVTIDNDEWIYAAVYADALRRGDRALAERVGADYLRYMDEVFAFCEDVSRRLTGREIRQVLLVHANELNADTFGRLADAIEARGYRYVTLDDALADEAYGLPDTYVGEWGISWLHHWEVSGGRKRSPSPDPPDWVTKAFAAVAR
jgi:peptidoglycan/xylan/chitin deacetylase (PgdA/CDA1 family)